MFFAVTRTFGHSGSMLLAELFAQRDILAIHEPTQNACRNMSLLEHLQALQHCDHIYDIPLRLHQIRSQVAYLRLKAGNCTAAPRRGLFAIIGEWPTQRLARELPSIPVVSLQRSNVMKHALSLMHTWQNHARVNGTALRDPQSVDFDQLLCRAHNILMARRGQFNATAIHTVWYEDLQLHPDETVQGIVRALNFSNDTMTAPVPQAQVMFKTGSDDLQTYVRNYHNISEQLRRWPCLRRMWLSKKVEKFPGCPPPFHRCQPDVAMRLAGRRRKANLKIARLHNSVHASPAVHSLQWRT